MDVKGPKQTKTNVNGEDLPMPGAMHLDPPPENVEGTASVLPPGRSEFVGMITP